MSAVVYTPPTRNLNAPTSRLGIFLAGSIEMGKATNWQEDVVSMLSDLPIDFYNPRRKDWDSSWKQEISNPHFYEQVTWELDHIESSNVVIFYFQPDTISPITLMELGLVAAQNGNVFVCCPEGYFRKGNVDIVCQRYDIPQFSTLDELCQTIRDNHYWSLIYGTKD